MPRRGPDSRGARLAASVRKVPRLRFLAEGLTALFTIHPEMCAPPPMSAVMSAAATHFAPAVAGRARERADGGEQQQPRFRQARV